MWNWTDTVAGDDLSEISLIPIGVQLEEAPVVLEVDETAGTLSGCSRGLRLSRIVRDNTYARRAIRRMKRWDAKQRYKDPRYYP